jgi:hypothetical protein
VRSMSASPIMPGELFKTTRHELAPSSNLDLHRGHRLLNNLEAALLITTRPESKYFKIEKATRSMLAQKIKVWYKKCSMKEGVYLPLPLRVLLRPGYLRGANSIRKRKVVENPWYAQNIIAQVYHFKLEHDKKAVVIGEAPISIAKAVLSLFMSHWGNADVADRFMHDFFYCTYLYELGIPRLRLFQCFFGNSTDKLKLDKESRWVLQTEKAVTLYLDFIAAIDAERPQDTANKGVMFPSAGINTTHCRDFWYEDREVLQRGKTNYPNPYFFMRKSN